MSEQQQTRLERRHTCSFRLASERMAGWILHPQSARNRHGHLEGSLEDASYVPDDPSPLSFEKEYFSQFGVDQAILTPEPFLTWAANESPAALRQCLERAKRLSKHRWHRRPTKPRLRERQPLWRREV